MNKRIYKKKTTESFKDRKRRARAVAKMARDDYGPFGAVTITSTVIFFTPPRKPYGQRRAKGK